MTLQTKLRLAVSAAALCGGLSLAGLARADDMSKPNDAMSSSGGAMKAPNAMAKGTMSSDAMKKKTTGAMSSNAMSSSDAMSKDTVKTQ